MHYEKENYDTINKTNIEDSIKSIYNQINLILFNRKLEFEYDKIFILRFIISHINNYYSKKVFFNKEIVSLIEKEIDLFKEILEDNEKKQLDLEVQDTIFYHNDISKNIFLYLVNKKLTKNKSLSSFDEPIIPFFNLNDIYKKEILKISKFDSNINNANILGINKDSFDYEIFQVKDIEDKHNQFDIVIIKNNTLNGKYYLFEKENNGFRFKYSYMSSNFKGFLNHIILNKDKYMDAIQFFKSINILSYSVTNHELLLDFLESSYEKEIKLIKINHYNSNDYIDHFLFPEGNSRTIYDLKNILSKIASLYKINYDWLFLSVYYNFIFKNRKQ